MHVLSHDKILAPKMVHLVCLMLVVQMNQLLVRALLRLSAHDVPPVVSIVIALPSLVGTTLVVSGVAPLAHAATLLLPFSSYPSIFARCAYHATASLSE